MDHPNRCPREGNAGELVMPELALLVINAQPLFTSSPDVFAG
jgi:hypothetical protein